MSDVSERMAEIIGAADLVAPRLMEELDQGGLVSDVIVIVKYIDHAGLVGLAMAWPERQDWIARRGMIETLRDVERVTEDSTE